MVVEEVSILVLVDVGLRLINTVRTMDYALVSILVLVDVGLRPQVPIACYILQRVSILVLVDVGLRPVGGKFNKLDINGFQSLF